MVKTEKAYPFIIFGASLIAGLFFLAVSLWYKQMHDAAIYIEYAQNIAKGGLWACGMMKEPGYPVLIAPLFLSRYLPSAILLTRILNIFLFASSSLIFYFTVRLLMSAASAKRSFVFSLLFALSPQLASFSALRVYNEPLQLFLNSIIIYCLAKATADKQGARYPFESRLWVIAALAMGWLAFTKSFFLVYPFWMVLFIFVHLIFFKKMRVSQRIVAVPVIIFLCISLFFPLMWSVRNYIKYGSFQVAGRGDEVMLSHTYLVDWDLKDSFKWGVFQLSDSLGRLSFPGDTDRMAKVTGEPYIKAHAYAKSGSSVFAEWYRLVKSHPFKYALFYSLNGLNHILFEGIYPDIFPLSMEPVIRYAYLVLAVLLHLLYSVFIWGIIITGAVRYALRTGVGFFQKLDLKYAIVVYSLAYFIFFAYHLHTEIRYFHPFYANVYLLFALSCDYLFRDRLNHKAL